MKHAIESYMSAYWDKYPNEEADDYTVDELMQLINNGASYHLTDYLFVVYDNKGDEIEVLFYCADVGSYSKKTIKHILFQHRSFMSRFDVPVFISNLNKLFTRDSISRYDKKRNQWRFI
jgi:hypothetical protein